VTGLSLILSKIIDDLIDEKFAPYYEDKKKHNNEFTMTW
jgi:hypothetical protein